MSGVRWRRPPNGGSKLGGEERNIAVIFVDIIGSTQLVTGRPATEVVELLNRFFAVIVEEVDRHHGFVNKFEGDAALAVFGAPNHLDNPESEALSASRAMARRIREEIPECEAGIGVTSGLAVAGNVGARERFEYTVIGEPVNQAARLCELAKDTASRLLASSDTVRMRPRVSVHIGRWATLSPFVATTNQPGWPSRFSAAWLPRERAAQPLLRRCNGVIDGDVPEVFELTFVADDDAVGIDQVPDLALGVQRCSHV